MLWDLQDLIAFACAVVVLSSAISFVFCTIVLKRREARRNGHGYENRIRLNAVHRRW